MWISWKQNLFDNLTINYAWNNYVLSKTTKLWKLITWATDLKIRIQKYHYKARNNSFEIIHLHAPFSDWWRRWWWLKSRPPQVQPKAWRQSFLTTQGGCLVAVYGQRDDMHKLKLDRQWQSCWTLDLPKGMGKRNGSGALQSHIECSH